MKRKVLIAALIITAVALGFLRDHIFVSINHSIESGNDAGGKLSMLKWILTILFSGLYLLHTVAMLYVLFRSKKYIRISLFCYSFLFSVSFLAGAGGYFISSFEMVYPFIRMLMGVAQSPVVLMILVPACFFDQILVSNKR